MKNFFNVLKFLLYFWDRFFYCVEFLVIFLGDKNFLYIVYMIMYVGNKFTKIRKLKNEDILLNS